MTVSPTILLIDDHALFRRGMCLLLGELMPELVISEATNCENAVALSTQNFDVIVMDWHMPGVHGFEALEVLKASFPFAALVACSSEENPSLIRKIMESGAAGFIPKSSEPQLMVGALRLVLSKGVYLPPQVLYPAANHTAARVQNFSSNGSRSADLQVNLTGRQFEILQMALKGTSNKLIAREFGISDGTVKAHLSTIYRVMNVRNRTEALYEIAKFNH
ncbi:MAG: response regulator transcription factor [Cytophagales bacterium]|nr:response regulator transcription factor [Cytophagales bacterium]